MKALIPDLDRGGDVLVGLTAPDDAAVYRLGDGRVLIATLDFFTPIVDDPFDYGRIAAANSLSDVYAMGGEPFLALSIAAFPDSFGTELMTKILHGAATAVREAGAALVGGHTVRDAEPKFGLCALGFAREQELMTKGGAALGDQLYLTKPLGTGTLSTALKKEALPAEWLASAVLSMSTLSRDPARAARAAGVRGGTDITGFGLAGHALEMATAAGVAFEIGWSQVPVLPGARESIAAGHVPGGTRSNRSAFVDNVAGLDQLSEAESWLLFDPQTSGGLLLAVPAAQEAVFLAALRATATNAWRIGRVIGGTGLVVKP